MGITVEFNPDLALRDFSEFKNGKRLKEECLPEELRQGDSFEFLKKGQRLFWITDDPEWSKGEMPLFKTEGNGKFSRPLASIKMIESTHFLKDGEVWTKGRYKIMSVFDPDDPKINFEAYKKV